MEERGLTWVRLERALHPGEAGYSVSAHHHACRCREGEGVGELHEVVGAQVIADDGVARDMESAAHDGRDPEPEGHDLDRPGRQELGDRVAELLCLVLPGGLLRRELRKLLVGVADQIIERVALRNRKDEPLQALKGGLRVAEREPARIAGPILLLDFPVM